MSTELATRQGDPITFAPATGGISQLLIALYSESGCGKTFSALMLARGIAGPNGKIAMADTESGRGAMYHDLIPGGYLHANIRPPFRPEVFGDALDAMVDAGAAVGIVDSLSHEWEGLGGVLEWADELESEGKKGALKWKAPKTAHNRLIQRIMQSPIPLIFCLRAKYKTRVVKEGGKNSLVKDDHVSPLQNEEFIFEMTNHLQINPDHSIILSKKGHPSLAQCYPKDNTTPLAVEHGQAIAKWAADPGAARRTAAKVSADPERLRVRILSLLEKHGIIENPQQWMWDEGMIDDTESFGELSADRLVQVGTKIKEKLEPA